MYLWAKVRDVIGPVGNRQRLHQGPAGKVETPDEPDLSETQEGTERFQGLVERRFAIPFMDLIQIDMIGTQAAQAVFTFPDNMIPRRAAFVRTVAHDHPEFGGDQHFIAPAL